MEIFKDLFILGLLVILIRKNIQIGHSLFITAILFGLLHEVSVWKLGSLMIDTMLLPSTLTVFAALVLITLLENVMRYTGGQSLLVNGVKNVSGDPRFAMAALPAIIGLLPSPGGARFSAPLVEEASKGVQVKSEQNAAINYWYRHIWEYYLPLYPSSLLAVEILDIPYSTFILVMLPFTIISIIAGLILNRGMVMPDKSCHNKTPGAWKEVMEGLAPIIAIMILVIVFGLNILAALILVIAALIVYYKVTLSSLPPMIKNALAPRLLYMVFAALYLRDVLMGSGAIDQLLTYFQSIDMNFTLIIILLPFSIGLLTGVTIPGISIGLPLVVSVAGPDNLLSMASVVIAANMAGLMLSPLHLCFIMSVEHFQANFWDSYRRLILPQTLVMLVSLAYAYLI